MRFRAFCTAILCALMLAAPIAATAQSTRSGTSSESVKKDLADTMERSKAHTAEKRDEVVEDVRSSLEKFDDWYHRRMISLKEGWAKLSDDTKVELATASKELRAYRNEMSEWLGKLQTSAKESWEETKGEFSKSYAKFKASWDKHDDETDKAGVEKKSP